MEVSSSLKNRRSFGLGKLNRFLPHPWGKVGFGLNKWRGKISRQAGFPVLAAGKFEIGCTHCNNPASILLAQKQKEPKNLTIFPSPTFSPRKSSSLDSRRSGRPRAG